MDVDTTHALAKLAEANPKLTESFTKFMAEVLGEPTKNAVGLFGGDWLYIRRMENLDRLKFESERRLRERGVEKPEPVSLSIALPLLHGASSEDREELLDLWARLLAAAMDPRRTKDVRLSYIETVKSMDPTDALVFVSIDNSMINAGRSVRSIVSEKIGKTESDVEVSFLNLLQLGCVSLFGSNQLIANYADNVSMTAKGRELKRVLYD